MADEAPLALKNIFIPQVTHTRCARTAAAVTPNDSADLPQFAYFGLVAQVAGTVKVDMINGGTGITFGMAAGILLPIQVKRVYNGGTSATGIVALIR